MTWTRLFHQKNETLSVFGQKKVVFCQSFYFQKSQKWIGSEKLKDLLFHYRNCVWTFALWRPRPALRILKSFRHPDMALNLGYFWKCGWTNFSVFLHVPSTTQGEKTHWFRFLKLYFLKVLFEHLKKPFYIWDIFEGTSKSYPILIRTSM